MTGNSRSYDHYHDLERWVTDHGIEPLWAHMMSQHPAAPTTLAAA